MDTTEQLSAVEVLTRAKALIANKANWTTQKFARDENNFEIESTDKHACKFCALGALNRITRARDDDIDLDKASTIAHEYLYEASNRVASYSITYVNDNIGHEAVMRVYDFAIAIAKNEETEK